MTTTFINLFEEQKVERSMASLLLMWIPCWVVHADTLSSSHMKKLLRGWKEMNQQFTSCFKFWKELKQQSIHVGTQGLVQFVARQPHTFRSDASKGVIQLTVSWRPEMHSTISARLAGSVGSRVPAHCAKSEFSDMSS